MHVKGKLDRVALLRTREQYAATKLERFKYKFKERIF